MQRQVLVNLGNRWAVLGSNVTLPRTIRFTPADAEPLKRVADESEEAERRILQTIRVTDARVVRHVEDNQPDIELIDEHGARTFVEIKVREHEPNRRDIEAIFQTLRDQQELQDHAFEIWTFNIQRLKLHIYSKRGLTVDHWEFFPLNVWEYGSDGKVFDRSYVMERVEEWAHRVEALYAEIAKWTSHINGIWPVQNRTVEMSEELMQKFAVPDRELPVLDIVRDKEPVISFIPRGLWIIGANGRIDIITRTETRALIDVGKAGRTDWRLVDTSDRRQTRAFDETVLIELVGEA